MVVPFNFKAVIWAGLAGGLVFMMLQMLAAATLGGGSPWGPPRLIAAMVMGKDVLPPPATFEVGVMAVGMGIHFLMSILLAAVFAAILSAWNPGFVVAAIVGAVLGLIIYWLNFYVFTAWFPWFANARSWFTAANHAIFGMVVALVYWQVAAKRVLTTPARH